MYLQHFGLTSTPFSLTPNTAFFVGVAPHIEAMEVLQSALQTNEGFIKVIGEVGREKPYFVVNYSMNYRLIFVVLICQIPIYRLVNFVGRLQWSLALISIKT